MFSVENRVGRLIEYRMWGHVRTEQIDSFLESFRLTLTDTPGRKVLCVDARFLSVMPPDVSARLLGQMKHDNPLLERSAILIGNGPTFDMQMERLVRESNNPNRMAFRSHVELVEWLKPVLTPSESQRAIKFYLEGAAAHVT
jgi:hypothetical protein